jgi:hypothetical protein
MKIKFTGLVLTFFGGLALLLALHCSLLTLSAQSTAFTYQGRLAENGTAPNGSYDLRFTLYDAPTGGIAVAGPLTNSAVVVSNGLFTIPLDFGAGAFPGPARSLEIGVRTNGAAAFSTILPRQPVTPSPYAITAANLSGIISTASIADGAITSSKIAPGAVSQLGASDGSPVNAVQVNSEGLLGIGTTNPVAGIQVASGGSIFGPQIQFQYKYGSSGPFSNLFGAPSQIVVSGNTLIVSDNSANQVAFIDISTPAAPVVLTNFSTALSGPFGMAVSGNLLAIACSSGNGFTLVDISNPVAPATRATRSDGVGGFNELSNCTSVAFSGNLLAVSASQDDAVTFVDVSTPTSPVLRSVIKNGIGGFTNLDGAIRVAFSGNLLAVASINDDSVSLVDTSIPTSPVLKSVLKNGVGPFTNLDGATWVAFSGNVLAIAAQLSDAVTLVNVSNPSNPQLLFSIRDGQGGFDFLNGPSPLVFSGNLLAVGALFDNAISLIDITSPTQPILRGLIRKNIEARFMGNPGALAFSGTNLAVGASSDAALSLLNLQPRPQSILSSGWIGIGVPVATAALDVSGDVIVQNSALVHLATQRLELGSNDLALASGAVAMGANTLASNLFSTAAGFGSIAMGVASTAMGSNAVASGYAATAFGQASASGNNSFAAGRASAQGDTSAALNLGLAIDEFAFAANAGFASGRYSAALGQSTEATGDNSMGAGNRAQALHTGSFVWADTPSPFSSTFSSTSSNQFLIRASGGVGIGTASPVAALQVSGQVVIARSGSFTPTATAGTNMLNLTVGALADGSRNGISFYESGGSAAAMSMGYDGTGAGGANAMRIYDNANAAKFTFQLGGNLGLGVSAPVNPIQHSSGAILTAAGVWQNASDINRKTSFAEIDSRSVLSKVLTLPVRSWRYTNEVENIRHLGPTAQDFKATFGLGTDDKSIGTVDEEGVALAAIQGLNQKVDLENAALRAELRKRDAENETLKQRLEKLERLIAIQE